MAKNFLKLSVDEFWKSTPRTIYALYYKLGMQKGLINSKKSVNKKNKEFLQNLAGLMRKK